jgi:hypothetical protein
VAPRENPDVDDREILLRVYLLSALRPPDAALVVEAIREHDVRTLEHYRSQPGDIDPAPGEWSPLITTRAPRLGNDVRGEPDSMV